MSETDLAQTELPGDSNQLDSDDLLKPEFVRAVLDAVDQGDTEGARDYARLSRSLSG